MTADTSVASPTTSRWLILVIACIAQFMVVLDATIVNVALPSIQRGLHFSTSSLPWVINGYTLIFGGFLLLGGRAADLIGRKRLFAAGIALFSLASLLNGFAQSPTILIVGRGLQGLGGALLSPAALSIVTTTFTETSERPECPGCAVSLGRCLSRAQLVRQSQLPAMDQRLHVAERQPHRRGDRLIVHVVVEAQGEHRAGPFRQLGEGCSHLGLGLRAQHAAGWIGVARVVRHGVLERLLLAQLGERRAAQRTAEERPDDVAGNMVEPGGEAAEIRVERGEVRVGAQERLLGQIGDVGRLADRGSNERSDPTLVPLDHVAERIALAVEHGLDELLVRDLGDRLQSHPTSYYRTGRPKFPLVRGESPRPDEHGGPSW